MLLSAARSGAAAFQRPATVKKEEAEAKELPRFPVQTVHAIVVGVSDYESNRDFRDKPLPAATTDARRMARVFKDVYGFDTKLLLGEDAHYEAIWGLIDEIEITNPDDAIVFFFGGHGHTLEVYDERFGFIVPSGTKVPDEVTELAKQIAEAMPAGDDETADTDGDEPDAAGSGGPAVPRSAIEEAERRTEQDPEWLGDRYIRVDELRDRLMEKNVKHAVMILDSCFSGAAVNLEFEAPRARGAGDERENSRYRLLERGSRIVVTAGMANETVWEAPAEPEDRDHPFLRDAESHGVFTRELTLSLTEPEQMAISTSELFDEVYDGVIDWGEANDRRFTPQRRIIEARGGDFVFVKDPKLDWLAVVQELRDELERDGPRAGRRRGGVDRGAGGARELRNPNRADIRRMDREEAERRLANAQPELDLMVLSQEIAKAQLVDNADEALRTPRWRSWARRNEKLAAQGDPTATASMALAYQHGVGVQKDPDRARVWATEARDTNSIEGETSLALLNGQDPKKIIEDAVAAQNVNNAQATAAVTAASFAAGSLGGGAKAGGILAGIIGGALIIGELIREPTLEELAGSLDKNRELYLAEDARGLRRRSPEQRKAIERWLNAAKGIEARVEAREKDGSMFVELAPTVSKRLSNAVNAVKRGRPGRNFESMDDAKQAADRFTDELLVLVASELQRQRG
ncbi:MAG: caspase family protein [Planctomycetota bacterium]